MWNQSSLVGCLWFSDWLKLLLVLIPSFLSELLSHQHLRSAESPLKVASILVLLLCFSPFYQLLNQTWPSSHQTSSMFVFQHAVTFVVFFLSLCVRQNSIFQSTELHTSFKFLLAVLWVSSRGQTCQQFGQERPREHPGRCAFLPRNTSPPRERS